MNYIPFIAFIFLNVSVAAAQPRICGLPSGASLGTFEESVHEIDQSVSPVIAAGLTDLYSLPDVQRLIAASGASHACVTAIPVGRNIYQYNELLVNLSLVDASGGKLAVPMLFQTASVQAHENVGPKPWVGFSHAGFTALAREAISKATFQEAGKADSAFTPMSLISSIFGSGTSTVKDSASYLHIPDVDPRWATFWVSQLRILDTGNPFTSQFLTDVGIVQVEQGSGNIRVAKLSGFFDLHQKMSSLQESVQPSSSAGDDLRLLQLLGR